MSNFDDVGKFHQKFGLPYAPTQSSICDYIRRMPHHINKETQEYRLNFLQEEIEELIEAYRNGDLANIADALVDIVYVAMGTAHLHNLPWQELWREVQRTNMKKERVRYIDESKRRSRLDVIKPKGWTPPQIRAILSKYQDSE